MIEVGSPEHKAVVALAESYLSNLSEEYYAAGWIVGWEYDTWKAVQDDGDWQFSSEEVGVMRYLSRLLGGWIVPDDDAKGWALKFVPAEEIEKFYQQEMIRREEVVARYKDARQPGRSEPSGEDS